MNFKNSFCIAMPKLKDSLFKNSVIYICSHDEEGAMGIVINKPVKMNVYELLSQINFSVQDYSKHKLSQKSVIRGGPVSLEKGFIIHSINDGFEHSTQISDELMLTTSYDILKTLGTIDEPSEYLVSLGCASWSKGQLEKEFIDDCWMVVPVDLTILFHTSFDEKWKKAINLLGIEHWQLVDIPENSAKNFL